MTQAMGVRLPYSWLSAPALSLVSDVRFALFATCFRTAPGYGDIMSEAIEAAEALGL